MVDMTAEQHATIRELQNELRALDLKADIEWAKYLHTRDEDCLTEVLALESERELKGMIAYIPKAGERKVGKIRALIAKAKAQAGMGKPPAYLGNWQARLDALDSINDWRAEYGLPPLDRLPKGVPGDSAECTLAKAFGMSMQELGMSHIDVSVQSGADVALSGYLPDGQEFHAHPDVPGADTVISTFDENAWLDLLTDQSLHRYAEVQTDDGMWERLEEVSAEFTERGLSVSVQYLDCPIRLGKDADPVRPQVEAIDREYHTRNGY